GKNAWLTGKQGKIIAIAMHVVIYSEAPRRRVLRLIDKGRIGLDLNLIAGGNKGQDPEPAIAPKAVLLIIRQECKDSIAIVNVRPLTFRRRQVPGKHQEQVGISLQRIVGYLALAAPARIETIVDQVVADYDSAPVAIALGQTIRPGQDAVEFRAVAPRVHIRNIDDDKIHPAGAEKFIMVIVVRAVVADVIGLATIARGAEILVVSGRIVR